MKLTLNKEFLRRHLFALVVLAGMGAWFGYDGFVTYPRMAAAELYKSIETTEPPPEMTEAKLEAFKAQKTAAQRGLCGALMLVALIVGLHLLAVSRLDFEFDENGFVWRGKRHAFGDVKSIDRSQWAKKGILRLTLADGTVTLDSWHHVGVSEFEKSLTATASNP